MQVRELAALVKRDSFILMASSLERRNKAIEYMIQELTRRKEEIFAENKKDLERASEEGEQALLGRLKFDEEKWKGAVAGLQQLAALEDPIGRISLKRQLDRDLVLERISCPIGVIGVVFESRPDALIQIASLCIKSGNAAILKGGREAACTNGILFACIKEAAAEAGLPEFSLAQLSDREDIAQLLTCSEYVDLLIPRGSNAFVGYIMEHTSIPVMGHADGVCHIYVDKIYDRQKAIEIVLDAKNQYPVACNAVETLLLHRDISQELAPSLFAALKEAGTRILAPEKLLQYGGEKAGDGDYGKEFLEQTLAVKEVGDIQEAIDHINRYGSHHTDAIITEDAKAAELFFRYVDSAGVYQNCSTRFADGFRYGFGAEVGIATGKLHARGPVGLEGLCTYKYLLRGQGQTVGAYAAGEKSFHFKDLI